jgi:hypothetical protein
MARLKGRTRYQPGQNRTVHSRIKGSRSVFFPPLRWSLACPAQPAVPLPPTAIHWPGAQTPSPTNPTRSWHQREYTREYSYRQWRQKQAPHGVGRIRDAKVAPASNNSPHGATPSSIVHATRSTCPGDASYPGEPSSNAHTPLRRVRRNPGFNPLEPDSPKFVDALPCRGHGEHGSVVFTGDCAVARSNFYAQRQWRPCRELHIWWAPIPPHWPPLVPELKSICQRTPASFPWATSRGQAASQASSGISDFLPPLLRQWRSREPQPWRSGSGYEKGHGDTVKGSATWGYLYTQYERSSAWRSEPSQRLAPPCTRGHWTN